MDKLPRIVVCFGIEGKELDINELTETLDIIPTHTRGIDDWPEIIKKDLTLPEELRSRYEWSIERAQREFDKRIGKNNPAKGIGKSKGIKIKYTITIRR